MSRRTALPYRIARWALGILAVVSTVAAAVCLRLRLHGEDYGPEFTGLLLFACFVGLADLFWWGILWVRDRLKAPIAEMPTEGPAEESNPAALWTALAQPHMVIAARVPAPRGARVEPMRVVSAEWDCDRPTGQISPTGEFRPLGGAELPEGVAKQIFELGRRVGRRDRDVA